MRDLAQPCVGIRGDILKASVLLLRSIHSPALLYAPVTKLAAGEIHKFTAVGLHPRHKPGVIYIWKEPIVSKAIPLQPCLHPPLLLFNPPMEMCTLSSQIPLRRTCKNAFCCRFHNPRFRPFWHAFCPPPTRDSYALFNALFLPLQSL